jgi:hypothetical protein
MFCRWLQDRVKALKFTSFILSEKPHFHLIAKSGCYNEVVCMDASQLLSLFCYFN